MRIVTYTTTDRVPPALQAIAKIMVESAFLPVVFYAATPEAAMIKAQEFWAARVAKVEQRRAKEAGAKPRMAPRADPVLVDDPHADDIEEAV